MKLQQNTFVVVMLSAVPTTVLAEAQGSSGAETIGKLMGLAFFGFIVMRIVNRKRDAGGRPTTSFLPWLLGFAAILFGFIWLNSKSFEKPLSTPEIASLKAKAQTYCQSQYLQRHANQPVGANNLTAYCECAAHLTFRVDQPGKMRDSQGQIDVEENRVVANNCRNEAGMPLLR